MAGLLTSGLSLEDLTPQENFLYHYHLNNLNGPGKVINPDGSISTVFQTVIGQGSKYYNIPTVWGGKIVSPYEALSNAQAMGIDKFPSYSSPKEADQRYMQMHKFMEQDVARYMKSNRGILSSNRNSR